MSGMILLVACGLIILFLEGSYLPSKVCRPITYPDGKVTTERFSLKTTDSIEAVLSFYDQQLNAQPWLDAGTNQWGKEALGNSNYLYLCYGVDINRLTTETGCIYVSSRESGSTIEAVLFRSEGGYIQCPKRSGYLLAQ